MRVRFHFNKPKQQENTKKKYKKIRLTPPKLFLLYFLSKNKKLEVTRWLSGQRHLLPNLITYLIPRVYMVEEENHFLQVCHTHTSYMYVCAHTHTEIERNKN